MVQISAEMGVTVLLAVVAFALVFALVVYRDRAKSTLDSLTSATSGYLDDLLLLLIGLSCVVIIGAAFLSLFGVAGRVSILPAEQLLYLAGAYAAVRWGVKQ